MLFWKNEVRKGLLKLLIGKHHAGIVAAGLPDDNTLGYIELLIRIVSAFVLIENIG
jgi:hypothetical protein